MTLIKDSFKIYFHEMEKLLPVERIFEELKISFHQPEQRICCKSKFTLGGKKLELPRVPEKKKKTGFH